MKVYIAGPMRGVPENNKPAFDQVAKWLRWEEHRVYNPADEDEGIDIRVAFASDTQFICLYADAVIMLPNWWLSVGARSEYWLANALDLPVFELKELTPECLSQVTRDLENYSQSPQASLTTFPTLLPPLRRFPGSVAISITPESHYIGTEVNRPTKRTPSFDTFSKGERSITTD